MQITFNFSELWFIFCLGQPKSILKKALSRPLHFMLMKFSALIKDLYRNLRNFQWLPLKFKDFSSYKDISPLFLDSEEGNERTRELATKPRAKPLTLASPFASLSRVACPNVGDWIRVESEPLAEFHMNSAASSSSDALFFAQRRAQNGCNWWQSAKDHEKERKRGEVPSRPFCASLHPLCAHFHRERENFGYNAVNSSLGVILLVTASMTWQVMQDVC